MSDKRIICVADKRQQEMTNAQDKAPPKSYLEAMEALLKWITHMESLLASETFQVSESEVMEEQLKQFKVSQPYNRMVCDWVNFPVCIPKDA